MSNRFFHTPMSAGDSAVWLKSAPPTELFHTVLSDGSDTTLNEDYSSTSATACYYTATHPCVITEVMIEMCDGSLTQNVVENFELLCGDNAALTNGIKFRVVNSAGTVLLDISNTTGLKSLGALLTLATNFKERFFASDGTAGNNSHYVDIEINFEKKFGRGIQLNTGDQFVAYLGDDLSALAVLNIHVFGFLV